MHAQVSFQAIYTTLFGWYASCVFVSTGHLTAAVAVHSFCNWMGMPDWSGLTNHRHGVLLLALTCGGVAAFAASSGSVLQPSRFGGGALQVVHNIG